MQSSKSKDGAVTMKNLNEYIVSVLKNILVPKFGEKFDFCDVTDLCCMPQFKFLQGVANPFLQDNRICCDPRGDKQWAGVLDSCLS